MQCHECLFNRYRLINYVALFSNVAVCCGSLGFSFKAKVLSIKCRVFTAAYALLFFFGFSALERKCCCLSSPIADLRSRADEYVRSHAITSLSPIRWGSLLFSV